MSREQVVVYVLVAIAVVLMVWMLAAVRRLERLERRLRGEAPKRQRPGFWSRVWSIGR